jgi:hypothetical protein
MSNKDLYSDEWLNKELEKIISNPNALDKLKDYIKQITEEIIIKSEIKHRGFDIKQNYPLEFHNEIAKFFINNWESRTLFSYLEYLHWIDNPEIYKEIIKHLEFPYYKHEFFFNNLNKIKFLSNNEIAEIMIEEWGNWNIIAENLDKLDWLNHTEIANKIIENWKWDSVARHLNNFNQVNESNHEEIAYKIIESWFWNSVAKHLNNFNQVNHEEIANKIIESWKWDSVAEYINNFNQVNESNHEEIAYKIIESWKWLKLPFYIKWFKIKNHKKIFEMLMERWEWENIAECLELFDWLNLSDYERLAKTIYEYWYIW